MSGYGFTGAGMNQEIYDALEKIVKASASITENSKTELEMYNRAHFLQVRYQLKSGSAVYRNYLVSSENLKELLIACYDQGTIKEKKYSFRVIEPEYLDSVNGIFADGENYVLFQDEPEKMHALLEAFLKDVQEADAESLVDVPCVKLDFFYEDVPMERRYSSNVPAIQSKENYCHSVNVYPQFKRTLALLEETGYALSVEDVEISEVKTIYIEAETEEGRELSEEFSYSTKEEIEALKECLVSSDLMPSWVEEDITLYSVKVSNSVSGEKEFWKVRKDREPDFLIKDRK